jgi:hypothetical protein
MKISAKSKGRRLQGLKYQIYYLCKFDEAFYNKIRELLVPDGKGLS